MNPKKLGRLLPDLGLNQAEEERLLELSRRGKSAQAVALRARIVLRCAQGQSNTQVARALKVCLPTAGKWRGRFVTERLAGVRDVPRSWQPRTITDAKIEEVIALTLKSKPWHATHWSIRSMAKARGLSYGLPWRLMIGVMRQAAKRLWKAAQAYWLPWSLWWMRPAGGRSRCTA